MALGKNQMSGTVGKAWSKDETRRGGDWCHQDGNAGGSQHQSSSQGQLATTIGKTPFENPRIGLGLKKTPRTQRLKRIALEGQEEQLYWLHHTPQTSTTMHWELPPPPPGLWFLQWEKGESSGWTSSSSSIVGCFLGDPLGSCLTRIIGEIWGFQSLGIRLRWRSWGRVYSN